MAGIVRAGAYRPVWVAKGRRVVGPDEDPFTMAATAAERAVGPLLPRTAALSVYVHGEIEASLDWAFGALLGAEARIEHRPPGPNALADSLAAARDGAVPALVVATDAGTGGGPAGESEDAGAVAFLVADAPASALGAPPGGTDPSGSPVRTARRWFEGRPASERELWVGDWRSDPGPGRPSPTSVGTVPAPPSAAVSEGAYVPRPRYREGLSSRWGFVAERCGHCGRTGFPARGRCRRCGRSDALEELRLPLDGGTVVATTWIGKGGQPTEFDPQVEATGPYGVALVELADGLRATLQLTDCGPGEVRIGDRVGTRLRRSYSLEGEWRYGRKAVPLATPPGAPA